MWTSALLLALGTGLQEVPTPALPDLRVAEYEALRAQLAPPTAEELAGAYASEQGATLGSFSEAETHKAAPWEGVVEDLVSSGDLEEAIAHLDEVLTTKAPGVDFAAWIPHRLEMRRDCYQLATEDPQARRGVARYFDLRDEMRARWAEGAFLECRAVIVELLEVLGNCPTPCLQQDHEGALRILGRICQSRGEVAEAEIWFRAAHVSALETFGIDDPKPWLTLGLVAEMQESLGNYALSAALFRIVLREHTRLSGPDSRTVAGASTSLAHILKSLDDFAGSAELYRKALDYYARSGEKDFDHASTWWGLSSVLRELGEYSGAEQALRAALDTMAVADSDDTVNYATLLNSLGILLVMVGDAREAEPIFRRTVEIYVARLGPRHPFVASARGNLADALSAQGRLAESEAETRAALEIVTERWGPGHRNIVGSLSNLATILHERGDQRGAEEAAEEALSILTDALGEQALETATTRSNVAAIALDRGQLERAEELSRKNLEIVSRAYPAGHPRIAANQRALGRVLVEQERYEEAEGLLRPALASDRAKYGDHESTLEGLMALGNCLHGAGSEEAAEVFREAVEVGTRALGSGHPSVTVARAHLGMDLAHRGAFEEAERHLARVQADIESIRTNVFGAERERSRLARVMRFGEIAAVRSQALIELGRPALACEAADRGRSRALLDLLERAGADSTGELGAGCEELDSLVARETRAKRDELEAEALRAAPNAADETREELRKAQRAARAAELAVLDCLRSSWSSADPVGIEEIRSALGEDEQLLFYTFAYNTVTLCSVPPRGERAVEGWVLASTRSDAAALRDRLGSVRGQLASAESSLEALEQELASLGAALVPSELRAALAERERVFVVPEGPLDLVPFERLLGDELHAGVVHLPSATFLQRMRSRATAPTTQRRALVVGDPAFSQAAGLSALPASRSEAEAVARHLERSGLEVTTRLGSDATLPAVERAARGVQVLHFATHGLMGTQERPYAASLALTAPEVPTLEDDGFLTLDRLVRRWGGTLESCELVALSACDSQSGVQLGDRVSLPWGFFYAGAPLVLASLWKVDDTATALFMARFYAELESAEGARAPDEALRATQEWMRTADRREVRRAVQELELPERELLASRSSAGAAGRAVDPAALLPYAHPAFWSGFALMGVPARR